MGNVCFSGWIGSKWRSGNFIDQLTQERDAFRKYWFQWAQEWKNNELDSNNNPVPFDQGAVTLGQREQIDQHGNNSCTSLGAHMATPNKPNDVENFQFSII